MRLGVIKPLETRKFIVMSRQYLGSTESEVIELWKNVMVSVLQVVWAVAGAFAQWQRAAGREVGLGGGARRWQGRVTFTLDPSCRVVLAPCRS